MADYDRFAKFYDAVMGERQPNVERILRFIRQYHPEAQTVLELGCGTGSMLKGLSGHYQLSGLDLSAGMLAIAKKKVPEAQLMQADLSSFQISESFDVIICVFDTLNHLLTYDEWERTFQAAHAHLRPSGIFIFDINTLGRLARLTEDDAYVVPFEDNRMVMDIQLAGKDQFSWDIQISESDGVTACHEQIMESAFPLAQIQESLAKLYDIREIADIAGQVPSDECDRLFFICQKSA